MPYLYEKIEQIKAAGLAKELPAYIASNLNSGFPLRPYQTAAFENFITYFEDDGLRAYPSQTLFHMATGSGKTLIMAGLMLYLYQKGYRNFLFFVNLSNIVRKTKDNFLNGASPKYLFSDEIKIGREMVPIKEVPNFQYTDESAINICFATTQSLHTDLWITKEGSLSLDDFEDQKVVLISDEAHHLNVETLQGNIRKMSADEKASYHSWESTIRHIFEANENNVLLEFTATCDTNNELLKAAYRNKLIFDYPLHKFRADRYSKEIKTLRSDIPLWERELQAVILNQYRLKVFQDNKIRMKPVILFKAAKIADSRRLMSEFIDRIKKLTGDDIADIAAASVNSEVMTRAFSYFWKKELSYDQLAQEIKEDFSESHIASANDDREAEEQQLLLNSLEEYDNSYRAVFEVKKLDEGWDVLNLFDIVRLYETRDAKNGKPGKSTISEAQLIGRGARYCPFQLSSGQPKYQRKYDGDTDNPLRVCEELYYHCQNSSRYVEELKTALRETGIDLDQAAAGTGILKESFHKTTMAGADSRTVKTRADVTGLPSSVKERVFVYSSGSGKTGEDTVFGKALQSTDPAEQMYRYSAAISEIAGINYAIVQKATCRFRIYQFNVLKKYFPNLKSLREFICDPDYLGEIRLEIISGEKWPSSALLYDACVYVLSEIAADIPTEVHGR